MYQKINAYVKEQHMLQTGDRVIVGVSGGADSVCLLFVLRKLQEEYGLELRVIHVHHGLRGASADADEKYVRELCEKWGIPLQVFHRDVRGYAEEHGMTEEEAGRVVRRQIFQDACEEWNRGMKPGVDSERARAGSDERQSEAGAGSVRIALAHHRNDNAETVLFHLCRGTGPKGLGGIAPVTGPWIRPLLCVERKEIESYLKKWGISYCTDETNQEDTYSRNKIRNCVYPYLEEINDRVTEHISRTAEQMRGIWEYLDQEIERFKDSCFEESGQERGTYLLHQDGYKLVPEALQSYVVHSILCEVAGRSKDIGNVHVTQMQELMDRQVGRRISLPYQMLAVRSYEGILLYQKGQTAAEDRDAAVEISSEEVSLQPENHHAEKHTWTQGAFQFRILERTSGMDAFPQNHYTKWFDYDIIKCTVDIRHREPGDYITIDKKGNTQKLKRYFINEKIPEALRDQIWLVADGHHIMWIAGYRQNQNYQITEDTKRILEIRFHGGEEDGRDSKSND